MGGHRRPYALCVVPTPVLNAVWEMTIMDTLYDECFGVFLRANLQPSVAPETLTPETLERPLATYLSYAEARKVQQALHQSDRECVIRFLGTAGGGD